MHEKKQTLENRQTGVELRAFYEKLDQITPNVFTNPLIEAVIYFGSRIDPRKTPRPDSDLDCMVITSRFVEASSEEPQEIRQQIQHEIGDKLKVDMQLHNVFPSNNIPHFKQLLPLGPYYVVAKENLKGITHGYSPKISD